MTLVIIGLLVPIAAAAGEITTRLDIEGMHCALCVPAVTKALKGVEGVKNVTMSAADNQVVVVSNESVKVEALIAAVTSAGFSAAVAKGN